MKQTIPPVFFLIIVLSLQSHAASPPESLTRLIQQAGNTDDDTERLTLLKSLREHPECDEKLRGEADLLITEIDKWIGEKQLDYFHAYKGINSGTGYDFGIPSDSPLHPLTLLYQGRMLVWSTLEFGNIISYPEVRVRFMNLARESFEKYHAAYPENRIASMYLGEPIPPEKGYADVPGAPEWAVYQRESLERLADIITWWIDHRMKENGEYGGGWGDDCEMWRWWVPVLIGFEDPKIVAAQEKFSRALMSQEHMQGGFTRHLSDVAHANEDSSDALTPMMHLDPDNPEWKNLALRPVELMETLWAGKNERGFLQFKSSYIGQEKISDGTAQACDTTQHIRVLQPAMLYWMRTGDARVGRLMTAWMDTWADAAMRAERGKPAGVIPSAIHWPDGVVGGVGENWWDPRNHGEPTLYAFPSAHHTVMIALLLTWRMTGDAKYLEPLRSMAGFRLRYLNNPIENPEPGSEAWIGQKIRNTAGVMAKYRFLSGNPEFDALFAAEKSPYMEFYLHGNRDLMTLALRDTARSLHYNFPGYTSEVRWTDRVLRLPVIFFMEDMMYHEPMTTWKAADTNLLYSTITGDPGDAGYLPLNAVRWLTPPRDIAALVVDSETKTFRAEMFNFGTEPRPMSAEFYLLSPGEYTLSLLPMKAVEEAERKIQKFTVTRTRTRVSFDLPPRKVCELVIHSAQK